MDPYQQLNELVEHNKKIDLVEKLECERSFEQFIKSAFHIVEPGTQLTWGWHLEILAAYLQAFVDGGIPNKRLIISIPPGCMKSLTVAVFLPAFVWIKHPEERILGFSAEQSLAIRDNLKMKQIITSEWYQSKWPLKLDPSQNEKTHFSNEKRGFRQGIGISAAVTGKRGNLLLLDDLNDAKQAFSDVIRQSVNDTFDQSIITRVNDPVKSGIITIQQRLHEDDITGHLLKKVKTKWTHLRIPMRYEGMPSFDAGADIGRPDLIDPRTKKGELLFPERFTEEAVQGLEESLGEYGVSGQLQQRPSPLGGGILKRHWFRTWPLDTPMPTCTHIFLSLDTAFSEADSKTSAFSACTRWGIFWHEQLQRYCIMALGMWFQRCGYDELRDIVKQMVKDHNPDIVLIEKKATGISLLQDMRRAIPGRTRAYSPGRGEDKISRAHSVSPILESGQVFIPNKVWALGDGKSKLGLVDYAAMFPTGAPPTADLVDTCTQALIYLRAGHWSGDHPDDEDDYDKPPPPKSEEEKEDTVEDSTRYYG